MYFAGHAHLLDAYKNRMTDSDLSRIRRLVLHYNNWQLARLYSCSPRYSAKLATLPPVPPPLPLLVVTESGTTLNGS